MEAWPEVILGWIAETPDITPAELQARLRAKRAPSAAAGIGNHARRFPLAI
jgi:hypothetical protein